MKLMETDTLRVNFNKKLKLEFHGRLAIIFILSATILGCSKKEDAPTTEDEITQDSSIQDPESESSEGRTIDLLQGQWEGRHDKDVFIWIFSGNELRMLINSTAEYRGKIIVNDSIQPVRIDLDLDEYKDGHVVEKAAVKTKGILSVNREILNVTIGTELKDYPQDFEPRDGTVKIEFRRLSDEGSRT
jgi:hypothetical protein